VSYLPRAVTLEALCVNEIHQKLKSIPWLVIICLDDLIELNRKKDRHVMSIILKQLALSFAAISSARNNQQYSR